MLVLIYGAELPDYDAQDLETADVMKLRGGQAKTFLISNHYAIDLVCSRKKKKKVSEMYGCWQRLKSAVFPINSWRNGNSDLSAAILPVKDV